MSRTALPSLLRLIACVACVALAAPGALADPPKRALPDYDGRGAEPTDAGDVLLWVPRIALSPLYLVSEYVVRRPIGLLVTEAERHEVPGKVVDIFTFDEGRAGFAPTLLFDFGLEVGARASAGIYFFWDDLIVDEHELRLRAAFGGNDWIELDFTNSFEFADEHELYLALDLHRRSDGVFGGIGPAFPEAAIGRYGFESLGATIGTELEIGKRGWLETGLELRHVTYFEGTCCEDDERSIQERAAQGYYAVPAGFERDHTKLVPRVSLALDTRSIRPADESGARAELGLAYGIDLTGNDASFVRTTIDVGGFIDVYRQRTLGLRLHTSFTELTGGDGVLGFEDHSMLGGALPMRAFVEGQLRGRSAVAATLEWRWPIWVWLDGTLFAELGNVFGAGLDGFELDQLRVSFGMGMRPSSVEDHPFELLFAFGTDTVHQGLDVTTFRVVFGTTSGF